MWWANFGRGGFAAKRSGRLKRCDFEYCFVFNLFPFSDDP
ncbi:hypothetical protein HMPREF9418_2536 [Neisseria macacae ATCC 33926]|uniref:Uncharacterized protein n=1 Tax=Neisseria macacae ATCC 33926 TaxID=997348 RepID=A0AA36UH04_9NEIS|nr:hypothetical protein HMPREF9418_2536 [Neisseria macacae ATCC 33926]